MAQEVCDLMLACLSHEPSERPTAAQLLQQLSQLLAPPPGPAGSGEGGGGGGGGSGSTPSGSAQRRVAVQPATARSPFADALGSAGSV